MGVSDGPAPIVAVDGPVVDASLDCMVVDCEGVVLLVLPESWAITGIAQAIPREITAAA
jgi:hypothetical protein